RFAPWLTETALGAMLAGIVSVPAMVFLLLVPGSVPPFGLASPVGWLPPVAAGVAALLPPGLLLQRLGAVRAGSSVTALLVVAAAMAALPALQGRAVVHEMVGGATLLATFVPAQVWVAMAVIAASGLACSGGSRWGPGCFSWHGSRDRRSRRSPRGAWR